MNLAYVDDYGHTGTDLANPEQPIYMLFALLVTEENWSTVEASLWGIITEIADKTGQDLEGFELHAKDFFNGRNRTYRALTMQEKAEYLNRIVKLVIALQCKCIAVHVVKADIQRARELAAADKAAGGKGISDHILTGFLPHPLVFSRLLGEIDEFSKLVGQNTVIIMDHQEEYVESRQMNAHALYRHQTDGEETRVLDMPFDGDGRYNILLQIADVLGWAFGRHLKATRLGQPANELLMEALKPLLTNVTSIDAYAGMTRLSEMPLAVGLFVEYGLRADKGLTGKERIRTLDALLAEALEDIKKGKENSNE